MSKMIEIVVAPNGQAHVETKGFTGGECRQASEFIERALGRKSGELLKAEFYQTAVVQQQVKDGL